MVEHLKNFVVVTGLRQGNPLIAVLFNDVLEVVMTKSTINRGGIKFIKRHQCLIYADDIILLVGSN